jgi:sugar diacid utilization regulator
MVAAPPGGEPDVALRDRLSSLQGLLVLSMLMTESGEEQEILHLAETSVPSLAPCHLDGVHLVDVGWRATAGPCTDADVRADLEAQFAVLSNAGGAVAVTGEAWGWAFPLRSIGRHFGYLVVAAEAEPTSGQQFLLRVLAQQTAIALANARLHERERVVSAQLRATNETLAATIAALERSTAIHERLTQVAVAGEGQDGLAQAVHELTGFPVAIEDRRGNLRAWAGGKRPASYPMGTRADREDVLRRTLGDGGKVIRDGDRFLVGVRTHEEVLGVIALIDPGGRAGEAERVTLEHGATVLAMELARLQSLADTELRVGRDLAEELLIGTDEEVVLARARLLGYNVERAHRVVVIEPTGPRREDDVLFQGVRRAARESGAGSLMVRRNGAVVLLADADRDWEELRAAVRRQLDGGGCRIGVGGACDRLADFPRSFREARLALRIQATAHGAEQATAFDDLGVYQILAEVEDTEGVERFARRWLGDLLDYDKRKRSDLVETLGHYLDAGRNHRVASAELAVHRSTLKYRLQRIKEISGHDLADPGIYFNLQLAIRAWRTLLALRAEHH